MDMGNNDQFENDDFSGFNSGDAGSDFLIDEYAPKDANNETIEPIQKVARNEENKSLLNFGSSLQIGDESPLSAVHQTQVQKTIKSDTKINNNPIDLKSFLQTPVGSIVDLDDKSNVTGSRLLIKKTIDKAQDRPKPKANIFPISLNDSSSIRSDNSSQQIPSKSVNNDKNENLNSNSIKTSQFTLPGIPVLSNDPNNLPPLSDKNNLNMKPQANIKTIKVSMGNTITNSTSSSSLNISNSLNTPKVNEEVKGANITVPLQNKNETSTIKVSIKPRFTTKQQSEIMQKQKVQQAPQISPQQQPISQQTQVQQSQPQIHQKQDSLAHNQQQMQPNQTQQLQIQQQIQSIQNQQLQSQQQVQSNQIPNLPIQQQAQQPIQQQAQQSVQNHQHPQQPNQIQQQPKLQISSQQQPQIQIDQNSIQPQSMQIPHIQAQLQQNHAQLNQQLQMSNPQIQPPNPSEQQQQKQPIQLQQSQFPINPNHNLYQPQSSYSTIPVQDQADQFRLQTIPSHPNGSLIAQSVQTSPQLLLQPNPLHQYPPSASTSASISTSQQIYNYSALPPQAISIPVPFSPSTERVQLSFSAALDNSFSIIRRSVASELKNALRNSSASRSSNSFSLYPYSFDIDGFCDNLNSELINALSFASSLDTATPSPSPPPIAPIVSLLGSNFNSSDIDYNNGFSSVNINIGHSNIGMKNETVGNGYQTMIHSYHKEPSLLRPLIHGIGAVIDKEMKPLSSMMKSEIQEKERVKKENIEALQDLLSQIESMRVACKNFSDEIIRELEREESMVSSRREAAISESNKKANKLRELKLQSIEIETKKSQQEIELRKNSELFDRLKQQQIYFFEKSNKKFSIGDRNGRIRRDGQFRSSQSVNNYEFEQVLDEIKEIENYFENGGYGQMYGELENLLKFFQNDKNNMKDELLNEEYFYQQLLSISKVNSRFNNFNNPYLYSQNRKPGQQNLNLGSNFNSFASMNMSKQNQGNLITDKNKSYYQNRNFGTNSKTNPYRKQRDVLNQSNLS